MSPPSEPPPDPALQRRVARPWERPETKFPAVVAVGTLQFDTTGPSAVVVTGLLAYSNGFEFFVTRLLRPDGPGFFVGPGPHPPHPRSSPAAREIFKVGVEFADGGQAFTGGYVDMRYDDEPDRPFLYPGGSSPEGTGRTIAGGRGRCRQAAGRPPWNVLERELATAGFTQTEGPKGSSPGGSPETRLQAKAQHTPAEHTPAEPPPAAGRISLATETTATGTPSAN